MFKFIFASLTVFSFQQAMAFPLPTAERLAHVRPQLNDNNSYDFEGIVALSNCSGSLIRLENAKDTDFAMVLTNGHCLETGFPDPGRAVLNQRSTRSFSLYGANGEETGRLHATQVLYSTMTKTDMTLYQLRETYADILSQYGVHAFTLASKHPDAGTDIQVVSGYWSRGYTCKIDGFAHQLKEDEFTFEDSIRYSEPGCEVIGGTSGSPIIAKGTRTIVGVNNTINEDNQQCTMNNPCEVDENGNITVHYQTGYGQETYLIYGCLNANGAFDTSVKDCQLVH